MKYYVAALLLLLDPAACVNPFGDGKRRPPKGCKTSKNVKQCDQDADLVARYGAQLCPAAVADNFERLDGFGITTNGLPHFLQPTYSAPLSDEFTTGGQVALTFEQAVSVCVTKCMNDPGCTAVNVLERTVNSVNPQTGKPEFQCLMVNAALGRGDLGREHDRAGAYIIDYGENGVPCTCSYVQSTTFHKFRSGKGAPYVPSFEAVQCNINSSSQGIEGGIGCMLGAVTDEAICGALLTDDWNTYMAPGITCVLTNGGVTAVQACLACLNTKDDLASDYCPVSADDMSTVFRSPERCATECLGATCETALQTALLCATGAPMTFDPNDSRPPGGYINGPDFACPPVE